MSPIDDETKGSIVLSDQAMYTTNGTPSTHKSAYLSMTGYLLFPSTGSGKGLTSEKSVNIHPPPSVPNIGLGVPVTITVLGYIGKDL